MRVLTLAATVLIACCAAPRQQPTQATQTMQSPEEREALSKRVDSICAMPPEERQAELVKLKEETGLALVCADPKKADAPAKAEAPEK
jgi:hypothetical protein